MRRIRTIAAVITLIAAVTASQSVATANEKIGYELVSASVSSSGLQTVGLAPTVTGNGRLVAFTSSGDLTGDGGSYLRIYLRDMHDGVTTRISEGPGGENPDGDSLEARVAADGSGVAFRSTATNIVPGVGPGTHLYYRDLSTGGVEQIDRHVPVRSDGNAPFCGVINLSTDARFATFSCQTGGSPDVAFFVLDRTADNTAQVDVDLTRGVPRVLHGISDDGRYLVYQLHKDNAGTGLYHVDRQTGEVQSLTGGEYGFSDGGDVDMTPDGRYVAFSTNIRLSSSDVNDTADIYLWSRETGQTSLLSIPAGETASTRGGSVHPTISHDGAYVAFRSNDDLVPVVGEGSRQNMAHVYRVGLRDGSLIRVSSNQVTGVSGNGDSDNPDITPDGSRVAFWSLATNLTENTSGLQVVLYRPVDSIAPVVTPTLDYGPNVAGWHNMAPMITWSSVDPAPSSGTPTVPAPTIADIEGKDVAYASDPSCDPSGNCAAGTTSISLDRTTPTVEAPEFSSNPSAIITDVTIRTAVADALSGVNGAEWFVGDDPGLGNGTAMAVADGAATATVLGGSLSSGVHEVSVRSLDAAGNWSPTSSSLLVMYDPDGGFVTGGGWIASPEGAYPADPIASGPARFGFVSKYNKGATAPTGETEFQFNTGHFHFHSSEYEWLVVSGPRGQYKGRGTVNGDGGYGFMLTAVDGQVSGGGGVDKFRLKIWDDASGNVVYDNQIDSPDDAEVTTALGGGSIKVHKP